MRGQKVLHSTAQRAGGGSDEWLTDPAVVACARRLLGGIELDLASCDEAQLTVQADRYYTKDSDALLQSWAARSVFLNPPFSLNHKFIPRLVDEFMVGTFGQAVLVVPARVETRWFRPLYSFPICFPTGRLKYRLSAAGQAAAAAAAAKKRKRKKPAASSSASSKKRERSSAPFPSALVYLGADLAGFVEHFGHYGPIVQALAGGPMLQRSLVEVAYADSAAARSSE